MHKFLKHHLYCIAHLLKFKMLQIAKSLCFCYKQTCSPLVLVSGKQQHQWTSGSVLCSMHRPCHCEGRAENLFLRKSLAGSECVQARDWNGGVYTRLEHMETDAKIPFLQVQLADLEHFWPEIPKSERFGNQNLSNHWQNIQKLLDFSAFQNSDFQSRDTQVVMSIRLAPNIKNAQVFQIKDAQPKDFMKT